jgi:uncharacterized protein (DUF1810 family)
MTLFALATDDHQDFIALLDKYYCGEQDPLTLAQVQGPDGR